MAGKDNFDGFFDDMEEETKQTNKKVEQDTEFEDDTKQEEVKNNNKGNNNQKKEKKKGGFPVILVVFIVLVMVAGAGLIAKRILGGNKPQTANIQETQETTVDYEKESLLAEIQKMKEESEQASKKVEPETDEFGDIIQVEDSDLIDLSGGDGLLTTVSNDEGNDDGVSPVPKTTKFDYDELKFTQDIDAVFTVTKFKVSEKENRGEYRLEYDCIGSISGLSGNYTMNLPYSLKMRTGLQVPVKYKSADLDEYGDKKVIKDLRIDYVKAFADAGVK